MGEPTELAPVVVEMRALPEFKVTETTTTGVWEQYVTTWRTVDTSLQAHHFMLGAIANSLTVRYDDKTVQRFAHEVRCSAQTVYERAATYRAWRGRQANPEMNYSSHVNAAQLSRVTGEEPEVILARFEDEGLSFRQQKELIASAKGRTIEPYQPDAYTVPTPKVSERLEKWKGHVRAQPCLVCGKRGGVQFAHFKALVSPKTGEMQSRKVGLSDWLGMPLCEPHHLSDRRSIHAVGEEAFILEHFGGIDVLMGLWATMLLTWLESWD